MDQGAPCPGSTTICLTARLLPGVDAGGLVFDSYANRVGKGMHCAVARYERFRDRRAHVLRCDIYRYFPAIDHAMLKADLRRLEAAMSYRQTKNRPLARLPQLGTDFRASD